MNLAAHEEQCFKSKMVFKRLNTTQPLKKVGGFNVGRRNKWVRQHRQQLAQNQQQLNGFDLSTLVDSSKNFLTSLTGKTATTSTGVPPLLARPATVTTVNAPLPVASKSMMTTISEGFKQIAPALTTAAGMAISLEMQKKLAKHNVELIKSGQQPVDMQSFMSTNAPVVRVEGGVDNNTGKYVMYAGIAVGAALLFMTMRKKS